MNRTELSAEAFEARYRSGRDPWSYEDSAYELNRHRAIITALRMAAYGTVYEPGCSVGVLTQQLGGMAKRVIACDFAPSAVEQAKLHCVDQPNVEVVCADLRTFVPDVPLDLIVFSEIGYFFSAEELARIAASLAARLVADGEFMAGHWLGESPNHLLHGDRVHDILRHSLGLCPFRSERHSGFRLDSWIKS
ncbi:MAG TPA: SAM-dependent methyltransferase [Steroidobacteraceae bacterium]|jgi:trans-aconitate methyltransferase|nr:SAM-dependent methyltransferase [Steroidobacteraceae bacterium]